MAQFCFWPRGVPNHYTRSPHEAKPLHGLGMAEAQEAVSKAIRRNLGTVRTFSCPAPALSCLLPAPDCCCAVFCAAILGWRRGTPVEFRHDPLPERGVLERVRRERTQARRARPLAPRCKCDTASAPPRGTGSAAHLADADAANADAAYADAAYADATVGGAATVGGCSSATTATPVHAAAPAADRLLSNLAATTSLASATASTDATG